MSSEQEIPEETFPPSPEEGGEKGKGKANEETVRTNYRVYCASRSYFISESLQIQRFMFPAEMPARLFDLDLHRVIRGTKNMSENARARSDRFRDENHAILQKLVHAHTEGIFGTRDWPCLVCGAAAVKLLHGLIPHFEVKAENDGGDGEDQGREYYGANISVPLTEGRIYRIGVNGEKGKMKDVRRWVNRLAIAPISCESEDVQDRLIPCIVDVTTPVCSPGCEQLANDLRKDLATEILTGTFKVDPEDMPWWAADEGMVPSADLKGAAGNIVQCVVCGLVDEDGVFKCGRCELVGYCGRNCQKEHWSTHKYHCDELRDRSHAAILVEMSQSGVEHTGPEGNADNGITGTVVRCSDEWDDYLPDDTVTWDAGAEDNDVEESKPKKKKNKGKRKRKGKGKEKSVEVEGVKNAEPDTLHEAEESWTEVGDVGVDVHSDKGEEEKKPHTTEDGEKNEEKEKAKPYTADEVEKKEEEKEEENKWLPLL